MTHRAWSLSLSAPETGRLVGMAVICAPARYASIQWTGADRIDRRHLTPAQWTAITAELADGLPPGPLVSGVSVTRAVLVVSAPMALQVQYLNARDVDAAEPTDTAIALDALLQQQVKAYGPA